MEHFISRTIYFGKFKMLWHEVWDLNVFECVEATAAAGSKMCPWIFMPALAPSWFEIPMLFCIHISWVVLECSAEITGRGVDHFTFWRAMFFQVTNFCSLELDNKFFFRRQYRDNFLFPVYKKAILLHRVGFLNIYRKHWGKLFFTPLKTAIFFSIICDNFFSLEFRKQTFFRKKP